MACLPQIDLVVAERRRHAAEAAREERARRQAIELGEGAERGRELVARGADLRREQHQEAQLLCFLLFAREEKAVVELDREERLDEERLARGGAVLDDARNLRRRARLHRHDEAIVAHGDVAIGDLVLGAAAHQALEAGLDLHTQIAQQRAQLAEARARVVAQQPRVVEHARQRRLDLWQRVESWR